MNVCDSEWLQRNLAAKGWEHSDEEEAQMVLINTCSVREKPEVKVYSLIGRLRDKWEKDPDFFVGVGGCVAQQVGEELWKRFPYVRLVFGTDGVGMVPDALDRLCAKPGLRISLLDFMDYYPEREQSWTTGSLPAQAYVNIMQGCNNFCAYCIVPYVRGRQKSRQSIHVLDECRALIGRGVREITLLGQNVNSYGLDSHGDGVSFAGLLESVASLKGLERLRFTTSHPKDLADEVISAFGRLEALCPQLHLPLQSGSNRILRSMGRKYTREQYLEKVAALRQACPDISLSTDFIVGFPGESESDFNLTLETLQEVGYDSSYSFKYCDRPGVRAESMPDKVEENVKTERLQRLQSLQSALTEKSYRKRVGKENPVLIEGESKKAGDTGVSWRGRDPWGNVVNVLEQNGVQLTNKFITAKIMTAKKHSLFGERRGEPW